VQLARGGANDLVQPALVGRVDVLVRLSVNDELALLPFLLDLLQARNDPLQLIVGEDVELAQGLDPGD
jgi:hypothetical protein